MNEHLLGFMLRTNIAEEWTDERRAAYLLNEQVKVPLSLGLAIWGKCKDKNLYALLFSNYYKTSVGFCEPNGLSIFYIKDEVLLQSPSLRGTGFLIGVTVCNETEDRFNKLINRHRMDDIPDTYNMEHLIKYGWKCLGYDVGDEFMGNGLMNCKYTPSEKAVLSKRYSKNINEYGLFNSPEIANEYRDYCNIRVSEHAPFLVYGLWAKGKPFEEGTYETKPTKINW